MASCRELRATIEGLKGKRALLLEQKESQAQAHRNAVMLGRKLEEAQTIIRTVALQTQQELQFRISSITTAALERATGTLQAGMKRLKEEFGCPSIEAAQKELAAIGTKREKLQTALNETLADLEEALNGEQ